MKPLCQYSPETALTVRVLTLRSLPSGRWELTDSLGAIGGLFVDMKTATRFAKMECGAAIVLVDARSGAADRGEMFRTGY